MNNALYSIPYLLGQFCLKSAQLSAILIISIILYMLV